MAPPRPISGSIAGGFSSWLAKNCLHIEADPNGLFHIISSKKDDPNPPYFAEKIPVPSFEWILKPVYLSMKNQVSMSLHVSDLKRKR